MRNYSIFGLAVTSDIDLPELDPVESAGEADVLIRSGPIGDAVPSESGVHAVDGGALLVVDRVARFLVEGGRRILVDPAPGANSRDVRLYLLGSAFGLLLHQRGLLPLHANAVEIDGKAVAFMGESGAGKSTLAAWFHDRGHRIIADDVCVVAFDDRGDPLAIPGLPRLRLWREVIEATGRDVAAYAPSFTAVGTAQKYDVPVGRAAVVGEAIPLVAVYLLGRAEAPGVAPLDQLGAVEAIVANTYRGGYLPLVGGQVLHWHACIRLVRNCPLFSAGRRWDLADLDAQSSVLLAHAEAQVAAVG